MSEKFSYKPEIDGLRAFAVIAVIVFHLEPSWLRGGFLGVDVFFVISGYLITAIINREIAEGTFTLARFWGRRIRRLYPALLVVLTATVIVGGILLVNPERARLVRQAVAALFSFSNIFLWKNTGGYWDSSSENIPLLHTWSLSLEEQFYICFPPALWLLAKYRPRWVLPFVSAALLGSLALSIGFTPTQRSAAFYFLPTRAWELLIGSVGSLIALSAREKRSWAPYHGALAGFGFLVVLASFFWVENDARFPGAVPLPVCLGTLFIIRYGGTRSWVNSTLTAVPVQYIGKISYSLYLWHWPLIVYSFFVYPEFSPVLLVLATFALASLTYHGVENPFRKPGRASALALGTLPVGAAAALAFIALTPKGGWVPRSLGNFGSATALDRGWKFEATDKILAGAVVEVGPDEEKPDLALVGSSHARVLAPAFADYAQSSNQSLAVLATSGVPLIDRSALSDEKPTVEVNAKRWAMLAKLHPRKTFVADFWVKECRTDERERQLETLLRMIAENTDEVVVLGQVPMIDLPRRYEGELQKYVLAVARAGGDLDLHARDEVVAANRRVQAVVNRINHPRVRYIDLHEGLAREDHVEFMQEGKLLYADQHHLNATGARQVFARSIAPLL